MNIKIVRNKYINTLLILMLFSATVHMLILFYFALISSNLYIINYFNILDIDLFSPNIFDSFFGNIFSFIFAVILYFIILKSNKIV